MVSRNCERYERQHVSEVPDAPGAYELLYCGRTVYMGAASSLRRRIREHARAQRFSEAAVYPTATLEEARATARELLEAKRPR